MRTLEVFLIAAIGVFGAAQKNPSSGSPVPVVLWHGMGDSCCNPLSMGYIKKLLKTEIPGVYVHSLMLGGNVIEDTEHGFFGDMNEVVANVCKKIRDDSALRHGFNAIGFSQGGLFLRALAQRCPAARIRNLISIGGPQQGIYGIPFCSGKRTLCNIMRHLLDYGAYSRFVQKISVQAQYWHDPTTNEHYDTRNVFLSDLNCELETRCNFTYRKNLLRLENFVLVKFLRDEMVIPKESEWFGYYPSDDTSTVVLMEQTSLYKKDLIGLKVLNQTNRLHLVAIDGQHLQVPSPIFKVEIIDKFLRGTVDELSDEADDVIF